MSSSGDNVKKKCPYLEKCYRKNPIHFSEMSHPHLEKLVINQLDGAISVPESLDFECSDRTQLMDQLKIIQMILRKQREKDEGVALQLGSTQVSKTSGSKNVTSDASDSLKEKVERHKKTCELRRENKLKEMDKKAQALTDAATTSKNHDNFHSSNGELDSIEVCSTQRQIKQLHNKISQEASDNDNFYQGKKRNRECSGNSSGEVKKPKALSVNADNPGKDKSQEAAESKKSREDTPISLKGTSLIELYKSCDSEKSRSQLRQKAIDMMKQHGYKVSVVEPGEFALKYALSAPYHLFYTRIQKSKQTYDQQYSITFPEILDKSLGEIVCSLQINFMVDVGWLCLQYLLAGQRTDMLILYGDRVDEEKLTLNINMIPIQAPTKFGCHHTKVMVLKYKDDGIRVVVSTANLYSDDWENRTQGLWISPHLPPLPDSANPGDGESPTDFKKDFERYLSKYRQPALTEWIYAVRRADFSAVNVFFVASVPGSHKDVEFDSWGYRKLAQVLSKHTVLPPDAPQWPIIAQSSSIGSLGPNYDSWLSKEIVGCMSREKEKGLKSNPNFRFIYPTIKNYKESFDCRNGSCCLPYSLQTHSKQTWVESYMYQWKAARTARDRAMPHIKSYTRLSPDLKRIPWFVLTSANLSKAAWGQTRNVFSILNYEAGVVFTPKIITGETTFPIVEEESSGTPVFQIPYDLPLTRYNAEDKPFVMEFFYQND